MALKLINARTLVSSIESIELKVYAHNGSFVPLTGLTTVGYQIFDSSGDHIDSGFMAENSGVPGLYEVNVELTLGDTLVAGNYFIQLYESLTQQQILNEVVSSQFDGLNAEIFTEYNPIVDPVDGSIAAEPADLDAVTVTPLSGALTGVPAALTVEGELGRITLDNSTIVISDNTDVSASLDGDPLGFFAGRVLVGYPDMIKADGSAFADAPTDVVANFTITQGVLHTGAPLANADVNNLGVLFALSDIVVRDTYTEVLAGPVTSITIPNTSATILTKTTGVEADAGSDVIVEVDSGSGFVLIGDADGVVGSTRVVDLTSLSLTGTETVRITFYRLPDQGALTTPDQLTIDYSRLPNPVSPGDIIEITYNIPAAIDLISVEKGADLAAAEVLLEQNQQREFHVSTDKIVDRNVVAGGIEGFTLRTKNFSDSDFSSPVTEKKIEFTYKELTPQSDVVLAEPEE
jgi:hypothetical protein